MDDFGGDFFDGFVDGFGDDIGGVFDDGCKCADFCVDFCVGLFNGVVGCFEEGLVVVFLEEDFTKTLIHNFYLPSATNIIPLECPNEILHQY